MNESTKNLIFPFVPKPVLRARRRLLQLRDEFPISSLQFRRVGSLNSTQKNSLVRRVRSVNSHVPCLHTHAEMARIITADS